MPAAIPEIEDDIFNREAVLNARAVDDRVRAAGGTLYPASAFPMSADDRRAHFGPVHATLAAARRRHDPYGLLTPGYEVFRPSAGNGAAAPGRGSGPAAAAGRPR